MSMVFSLRLSRSMYKQKSPETALEPNAQDALGFAQGVRLLLLLV